jgi:NitT/TauT family transport system substrate-binding protein
MKRSAPKALTTILLTALALLLGSGTLAQKATIGLPGDLSLFYSPLIVADELGYFGDLKVEFVRFGGGSEVVRQVATGRADIGFAQANAIVLGQNQEGDAGIPVRYFYMLDTRDNNALAVPIDSEIQSIEDLRGKTIGISSPTASNVPIFYAVLSRHGIDPDFDVSWLPVGLGASHAHALSRGEIDVSATNTMRHASYAAAGVELRQLDVPEFKSLFSNGLLAHEDAFSDPRRREIAVAIGKGAAMGSLFCLTSPEACLDIVWKGHPGLIPTDVSEEEAREDALRQLRARLGDIELRAEQDGRYGFYPEGAWEAYAAFLAEAGDLEGEPDYERVYTNELAEEISGFEQQKVIQDAQQQ